MPHDRLGMNEAATTRNGDNSKDKENSCRPRETPDRNHNDARPIVTVGKLKEESGAGLKRQRENNGNPKSSESSKKQGRRKEEDDEEEEEEEGKGEGEQEETKLNVIPMNRVQRIAKSAGLDSKINQEAYFLINKATEKFIAQFCEDAYTSAAAQDRRRYVKYSHLSSIVAKERRYDFLTDFVPEKIKFEDALKEIQNEET